MTQSENAVSLPAVRNTDAMHLVRNETPEQPFIDTFSPKLIALLEKFVAEKHVEKRVILFQEEFGTDLSFEQLDKFLEIIPYIYRANKGNERLITQLAGFKNVVQRIIDIKQGLR